MIDSTTNKTSNQSEVVLKILKELQTDFDSEKQKEELRKKYEQYKKMFFNEKTEKDAKIKEISILKTKDTTPASDSENKEIRVKLEALKINFQKEY